MSENIFKKRLRERIYYSTHRENFKVAHAKYYVNNKEKMSARMKTNNHKRRLMVLEYYGGKPTQCACCGERGIEFLTVDHIENNGHFHRKTDVGAGNICLWLIRNNFPDGFQILCFNCNITKGFYGVCAHKIV